MYLYMLHVLAFALVNAFLAANASVPVSANDLHAIARAYHEYEDWAGRAPAKVEDLKRFMRDERLCAVLKNGDVEFYYGVSIKQIVATTGTSLTMLAHEKDAPTKGGWIVMFDGSVKRVSPDEFKKVIVPPH